MTPHDRYDEDDDIVIAIQGNPERPGASWLDGRGDDRAARPIPRSWLLWGAIAAVAVAAIIFVLSVAGVFPNF